MGLDREDSIKSMEKIVTIVGARPQFVKAAPVSREIRKHFNEVLVHTGQHYDKNMSQLFFDELEIPEPDVNLEIGSGNHGEQTAQMLVKIEDIIKKNDPAMVLVYGDTNSTLAGALAASKLNIPVAHVEAGLRSFNRDMPEEVNRVLTDRISDRLFCPTRTAVIHLEREGVTSGVHMTGDVMLDAAMHFAKLAEAKSNALEDLDLKSKEYLLATCHRPQNTDQRETLGDIVDAMIHSDEKIVFPLHPRTRSYLQRFELMANLEQAGNIQLIDPVGYLDMIQLEKNARMILTDSGGVQKEAYFFRVPCVTMRPETEWTETVTDGWNVLVGNDKEKITNAIRNFSPAPDQARHYGSGQASAEIASILQQVTS